MASSTNTIGILIQAKDHASQVLRGVGNNVEASGKKASNANAAFAGFTRVLGSGMMIAGAAAATGMAVAVKSAGTYESSLSKLKQASGANAEQMAAMSTLTRQLGKDNTLAGVTASDAAATMVELSKAGLSVNDTLAASKGVMSLAKAGNIEFADAAVIAASALNAFGLSGKDAAKVADMLAAGANASQADLSDLALGMQASATVAKQFGLSLNENVTALALFANNGIKSSDAGTSLKTMLISLAKPSKESAEAMKAIGFNAYDAAGNFVGLEEMSKRLNNATKGLTKEQKQNTLATIFGTDAFRAAAVLSDNAGKSYEKMSKSVGKAGAAQEAAAAQMGPYEKATEGLSNAFSDLGITIGNKALPAITSMTNGAAGFIGAVNAGIPGAISTFKYLLPVITSLSAGLIAFTVVQNAATVSTKGLTLAQGALNFVMKANPMALLAGAAVGIVTAYAGVVTQTNNSKSATDRLKLAQDALRLSTDAVRGAQQAYKDALLGQEAASLRTERAQKTYNEAVRQYGPKSLEAREALVALKQAQQDQSRAVDSTTSALRRLAEEDKKHQQVAKNVVAANNAVRASAIGAASGYAAWAQSLREARNEESKGANRSPVGRKQTQAVFGMPGVKGGFSSGGFTGRGGTNEPAGIVHRGEFVVPKRHVDQTTGRPKSESSSNGGITLNIGQLINNNGSGDYHRMLSDIGFALETAS